METPDVNVLNNIVPRLVPVKKGEPILGLEILSGPYAGVVFSFKSFHVKKYDNNENIPDDGMIPTTFETEVHQAPADFKVTEDFDYYCAEILVAWLHHISITNYSRLIASEPEGIH